MFDEDNTTEQMIISILKKMAGSIPAEELGRDESDVI